MKELKFYVLSADQDLSFDMSGYSIADWDNQTKNEEPTSEAKEFIEACEKNGTVFTASEFMYEFNINESIGMNDYIFITNKY